MILNWNTIPTKLQRAIFQAASSIQDNDQAVPLKNALAKFLHDHNGDAPKQ